MPLVSIGLPVFNGENYIHFAIDSLLSQTFPDFELIISDNASTDKTAEICRAYAAQDKRIRFFRNEKNLGASINFNSVFERRKAKYFKWTSHDDSYAPEFLERCVDPLEKDPSLALCYAQATLIDEKGQKIRDYDSRLHLISHKPHNRLHKFMRKPPLCNPIFGVIRSDILATTNLLGNYESSDFNLLVELCLRGKFWEHDEYLFLRRDHSKMSRRAPRTGREYLAWFDPKRKGANVFPYVRLLKEVFKSVSKAPISFKEKALCFAEILGAGFVLSARTIRWMRARSDPERLY
jgi:glycosyltransferase involved in cell wall biosynthesis